MTQHERELPKGGSGTAPAKEEFPTEAHHRYLMQQNAVASKRNDIALDVLMLVIPDMVKFGTLVRTDPTSTEWICNPKDMSERLARTCFDIADAMVAEAQKRGTP